MDHNSVKSTVNKNYLKDDSKVLPEGVTFPRLLIPWRVVVITKRYHSRHSSNARHLHYAS